MVIVIDGTTGLSISVYEDGAELEVSVEGPLASEYLNDPIKTAKNLEEGHEHCESYHA